MLQLQETIWAKLGDDVEAKWKGLTPFMHA